MSARAYMIQALRELAAIHASQSTEAERQAEILRKDGQIIAAFVLSSAIHHDALARKFQAAADRLQDESP